MSVGYLSYIYQPSLGIYSTGRVFGTLLTRQFILTHAVLDDVQKFNYLHTQLLDEASHPISGFILTSANYQEAVALLQECFGETDKIIQVYMRTLSNLPKPTNNASSLQHFYDTVESLSEV